MYRSTIHTSQSVSLTERDIIKNFFFPLQHGRYGGVEQLIEKWAAGVGSMRSEMGWQTTSVIFMRQKSTNKLQAASGNLVLSIGENKKDSDQVSEKFQVDAEGAAMVTEGKAALAGWLGWGWRPRNSRIMGTKWAGSSQMKQAYITETRMSWVFLAVKGWCNIMNHCGSPGKVSSRGGIQGSSDAGSLGCANGCGLNISSGILLTRPCQQLTVLSHHASHTCRICAAKAPSCGGSLWGGHSLRHKESGGNSLRSDLDALFLENNKNMENAL